MLAAGIDRDKREGDAETPAFQFQPYPATTTTKI